MLTAWRINRSVVWETVNDWRLPVRNCFSVPILCIPADVWHRTFDFFSPHSHRDDDMLPSRLKESMSKQRQTHECWCKYVVMHFSICTYVLVLAADSAGLWRPAEVMLFTLCMSQGTCRKLLGRRMRSSLSCVQTKDQVSKLFSPYNSQWSLILPFLIFKGVVHDTVKAFLIIQASSLTLL